MFRTLITDIKEHYVIDIHIPDLIRKVLILDYDSNNSININSQIKYNNIILTNYSSDIKLFETPTINKIREFSIENPGNNLLYLHTKGVSHELNVNDGQFVPKNEYQKHRFNYEKNSINQFARYFNV